jgi:hypothetical protein|tara:strand:- start:6474 stop:6893 length:420 start_codon:yes stop_codon:yes gene_type:complete
MIFSTSINIEDLPSPKKIGTLDVDGILHYMWIPPQADSRNKKYLWELRGDEIEGQARFGLYMNQRPHPQLQPVIVGGIVKDNTYVNFYSYCQYRFEWRKILNNTWDRFKREKMFLLFYLVLMVGIVLGIRLTKNKNADI